MQQQEIQETFRSPPRQSCKRTRAANGSLNPKVFTAERPAMAWFLKC